MPVLTRMRSWRDGCARTLRSMIRWGLERAGLIEPVQLTAIISPHHPDLDALPLKTIVVVGDVTYKKWAFLTCPCGCGEPIMLSLSEKKRPRWQIQVDWLGRPTVKPSIWQSAGCYSHFWVKEGRIQWTADTGRPHPRRTDVGR